MPVNTLNHNILNSVASTDIPVSSTLGSSNNIPDNSMATSNLSGESNAARQQLQQGSFHLQAEIIETGTRISEGCCPVNLVTVSSEIFDITVCYLFSFSKIFLLVLI
jgi:hypothetical protein